MSTVTSIIFKKFCLGVIIDFTTKSILYYLYKGIGEQDEGRKQIYNCNSHIAVYLQI